MVDDKEGHPTKEESEWQGSKLFSMKDERNFQDLQRISRLEEDFDSISRQEQLFDEFSNPVDFGLVGLGASAMPADI
jgi:hypothetical protein